MDNQACSIILASGSPRRRELLAELVRDFTVQVSNVDEDALTEDDPWKTAGALAAAKARAVAHLNPQALVIGGDTVVALTTSGGHIQLAKPLDRSHAIRMLQQLSGREHQVITGVALICGAIEHSFTATSSVTFRSLQLAEIEDYVNTGEPMDKAGAYAIQGGAAKFVAKLDGSLTNVIGLPLEELRPHLMAFVPALMR